MIKKTNVLLGVFFLMLGLLIVPINDALAKFLSANDGLNIMEIIWSRFFGHFIFLVPLVFYLKGKKAFINKDTTTHFIRGLLIFGSTSLFFLSIKYIPLANALSIMLFAPIIVVVASSKFLGESLTTIKLICCLLGFIGTLFVIQPGLKDFDINSIYAFFSGIGYAFYVMYTRKLNFNSSPIISLCYTAIPGALIMTLLIPFYWEHTPTLNQVFLMSLIGPVVICAHFFIIKGYQFAEASVLAPIHYFEIFSNVLISVLFFKDPLSIMSSIGIMCIISSGVMINLKIKYS